MSNLTYEGIWREAQRCLEEVVAVDSNLQNSPPQRDRKRMHRSIAELYVRYIGIANKLESCYDQMDTELVIPHYFRGEREEEISSRRKFIEITLRKVGALEETIEPKRITETEAIRLIQSHERARQGRARFQFMKEIRETKERSTLKSAAERGGGADNATAAAAAAAAAAAEVAAAKEAEATLKIQKVWRGYVTRYRIRKRRIEEMLLIGMVQPSRTITETSRKDERIRNKRREKQREFEELYERMKLERREFIRAERAAIMEENIRAEIRNWINSYFQHTGKIPELPSAESGGSRIILSRQGTESSMSKSTTTGGSSSKESKKSKSRSKSKKKESPESGGGESQDESDPGMKIQASNFVGEIIRANEEYTDIWRDKDESVNPRQLPYEEIIENEKSREIEEELRVGIDDGIRGDLEALRAALDRDRGFRGKRGKKSQKRVRRSGKKNKRKKEKDLTPDRTTESLFEELVTNGIIKLCPEVRLSDYIGEKSFGNFEVWQTGKDPMPAIGEIRQAVGEYCVIPLGNETIRQLTPLVRSVLIAGPHGSGKKMLVRAICTELGATLFDVTPANIAGKYPGKSGLIMLLHLISKLSRLLQPSVIFMDGAEKPFVKKVPKTDKTDPKRLKKDLPKLIKSITSEDRVIFVGTSSSPWEADQKLFFQTYDKVLYIPRPDYGTVSLIWKDLLYKYAGINRQFDTSAMTKISDGFTVGTIIESINEIMTTKRMVQLRVQPLTHVELVNALSSRDPIYREEEDAFLGWFAKTPTRRKKQKSAELEQQKLEEASEKQKKKGKGKKK
ncbi:dynein regulatory complex protein 11 isoform X2 [Venturia canescens]|uniref:dynein regulatory complex protein 11 isoform X2 n=1 Tax=Venturia canescens TaxID=32260 RepID=UPI001C9C2D1C|nr:dynein regulatory complex protein 11 isoform X2 [Venturia canescens]